MEFSKFLYLYFYIMIIWNLVVWACDNFRITKKSFNLFAAILSILIIVLIHIAENQQNEMDRRLERIQKKLNKIENTYGDTK
jgi:glucan phosphoethanolaminetransferase (alkaline phosphatase superfamily)